MVAEDQLGGRLPLLDTDTLDDEQRELVDYLMRTFVPWSSTTGFRSRTPDGTFIGPFNALLRSPALAGQFLQFQTSEQQHTSLSDRVRQVVILAVGTVWAADYELYAHSAVARHHVRRHTESVRRPWNRRHDPARWRLSLRLRSAQRVRSTRASRNYWLMRLLISRRSRPERRPP